MQSWANLVRGIALLFSGFVTGFTAWNALRKTSHEVSKDDKEELRADRDSHRNRWLENEKAFDETGAEDNRLCKKTKRLESTTDDFKEKEDKR